MKIAFLGMLVLTLCCCCCCNAQSLKKDSITIDKIANRDAKEFYFNKKNTKAVLANLNNYTSDYFKPTSLFVSDTALLNDSLYVRSFKKYAAQTIKSRQLKHNVFLTGKWMIAIIILLIIAISYFVVRLFK